MWSYNLRSWLQFTSGGRTMPVLGPVAYLTITPTGPDQIVQRRDHATPVRGQRGRVHDLRLPRRIHCHQRQPDLCHDVERGRGGGKLDLVNDYARGRGCAPSHELHVDFIRGDTIRLKNVQLLRLSNNVIALVRRAVVTVDFKPHSRFFRERTETERKKKKTV